MRSSSSFPFSLPFFSAAVVLLFMALPPPPRRMNPESDMYGYVHHAHKSILLLSLCNNFQHAFSPGCPMQIALRLVQLYFVANVLVLNVISGFHGSCQQVQIPKALNIIHINLLRLSIRLQKDYCWDVFCL